MIRLSAFALCVALLPALSGPVAAETAAAEPVNTREARRLLYRDDRTEVVQVEVEGLSAQELTVLTSVAQTQKYYAAIAFAPDPGLMSEATVMAANYHHPQAARDAALAECNARRDGGRACVIALEVRPQGWEERALMLGADATTAFNDEYRRAGGERAFAVSGHSGQWGIGRGSEAAAEAITACVGDSDVSDCAVVIAD